MIQLIRRAIRNDAARLWACAAAIVALILLFMDGSSAADVVVGAAIGFFALEAAVLLLVLGVFAVLFVLGVVSVLVRGL